MENQDFYEGMKTDRELDKEHVDAAEHFVRLKTQTRSPGEEAMLSFARGEGPELFEKEAGLPEATKGDTSPRTYHTPEGHPMVGWDSRKGYNFTSLEHEGKHHTLVDHHSSGRVGHIVMHPETSAIESSEIHPSHKHMTERFHETARVMHQHLRHAHKPEESAVKTAMQKLGYEIKPSDRPSIPKKDFAQPGKEEAGHKGKYPIPDRQHAKSALGFAKMHGDTAAYEAVRRKVMQKYPDMLGGEEKDSCMTKGAENVGYFVGPRINRKIEEIVDVLKKAKAARKEKDSCMGKSAQIGGTPPAPTPPLKPITAGTSPKVPSLGMPKMASGKILNARNLGSAVGALLLGGSTYLASRPRKEHHGKSEAEVELADVVRGQKAEGERHAGFVKKMKNRLNEFNHGVSKVFREHPVKGALVNAVSGATLGRYAAKALGG
jgi:hypothetical protein